MSILGYSSSYFLPEYWSNTPLYGEKIIPLIDYILSADYTESDKLANAFYNLENKYKNTGNLPIDQIEAIIEESGYGYVRDLLANDEDSLRLLVYLLVLIHELKGSGEGIQVVLNLLKSGGKQTVLVIVGEPTISKSNEVSDFTTDDYLTYRNFTTDDQPFELKFQIRTSQNFAADQCIASIEDHGLYLGINTEGKLVLSIGNNKTSWNIMNHEQSSMKLLPNSVYYLRLSFDGNEYVLQISEDDKKYDYAMSKQSSQPLLAHSSTIYVGVDASEGDPAKPYLGYVFLGPLSFNVENTTIEQWFEQDPIGEEDTFMIKADLDINLLSSDFFRKFADFAKKYVYPSLAAFEAKVSFENNVTFLPYIRQKVLYIGRADLAEYSQFMVLTPNASNWEDFFSLGNDGETYDAFQSLDYTLIPVGPGGLLVLTGSNDGNWTLPDGAYANNGYLENLVINGAKEININYALSSTFRGCSALTTISVPSMQTINAKYALSKAFELCQSLSTIEFLSLKSIKGGYAWNLAFQMSGGTNMSLNLPVLTEVSGDYVMERAFYQSRLKTLNIPELKTISGNHAWYSAFTNSNVTSLNLPKLTSVSGDYVMERAFENCRSLSSVNLDSLSSVTGYYAMAFAFQGSRIGELSLPKITSTSFGSSGYLDQFMGMVRNVNCTVHFPQQLRPFFKNYEPSIGNMATFEYDLPVSEPSQKLTIQCVGDISGISLINLFDDSRTNYKDLLDEDNKVEIPTVPGGTIAWAAIADSHYSFVQPQTGRSIYGTIQTTSYDQTLIFEVVSNA